MERPLKVARPVPVFTAAVVVPFNTPPGPALFWIARTTFCAVPVTVLPFASWRVTTGCVGKATPPVLLLGLVVKASFAAGPAVMLNALLVAPVSGVLAAVSV